MTRHRDPDDDPDLRDPEEPDDFDRDDDDSEEATDTDPCPFCRQEVHAQTDICPHCGNFIIWDEHRGRSPRGLWILLVGLILLVLSGLGVLLFGQF